MALSNETPVTNSNAVGLTPAPFSDDMEKSGNEHVETLENIHTNERVPGHDNYYEKDGLRTYGDGQDHDHEPPVRMDAVLLDSS